MDFVYVTERGWRHIVWDFGSEHARHSFGLANESTRHVNSTNDFSPRVTTSNFVVWRSFLEYGRRKSVIFQRWAWLGQINLVCGPIVAFGPFQQNLQHQNQRINVVMERICGLYLYTVQKPFLLLLYLIQVKKIK